MSGAGAATKKIQIFHDSDEEEEKGDVQSPLRVVSIKNQIEQEAPFDIAAFQNKKSIFDEEDDEDIILTSKLVSQNSNNHIKFF